MALKDAKRTWSARNTDSIKTKMDQAMEALGLARNYMHTLQFEFEELYKVKMDKVVSLVDDLLPVEDEATDRKKNNIERVKKDIIFRYEEVPDLKNREHTGARFIQAVAVTASHIEPARLTANNRENFFFAIIVGNELTDRSMQLVRAIA